MGKRGDPELSLSEAARILGVSLQAVQNAVRRGVLPGWRAEGRRRVRLSDVLVYGVRRGIPGEAMAARLPAHLDVDGDLVFLVVLDRLGLLSVVRRAQMKKGRNRQGSSPPASPASTCGRRS